MSKNGVVTAKVLLLKISESLLAVSCHGAPVNLLEYNGMWPPSGTAVTPELYMRNRSGSVVEEDEEGGKERSVITFFRNLSNFFNALTEYL